MKPDLRAGRPESFEPDLRAALQIGISRLDRQQVPSATLAAELLLMHVLGRDRAWLYAHIDARLDSRLADQYFVLIERRAAGTPTQYLTGRQEFWGLEFAVTPDVLIPRPETEHVVEVALDRVGRCRAGERLRIADVGTGSGCLAVALAVEFARAQVFGTDISAAALEVARHNAKRHGVDARVHFVRSNLLGALLPLERGAEAGTNGEARDRVPFDLIVSNPPYVALSEKETLAREVAEHEPSVALFSGADGLATYPALTAQAREALAPGGLLVMELGYNLSGKVISLLGQPDQWSDVRVADDLAGIPRVVSAVRR